MLSGVLALVTFKVTVSKHKYLGTSLVVQWLRLLAPKAGAQFDSWLGR